MSVETGEPERQKKRGSLEALVAFHGQFHQDVNNFNIFVAGIPEGPKKETANKLARAATSLLERFDALTKEPDALVTYSHDVVAAPPLEKGAIKQSQHWSQGTLSIDKWWREAFGLMEEMRWERQRLFGLQNPQSSVEGV